MTPWYIKLLMKFFDPFMILLELAAVLCFVLYGTNKNDPNNSVNLWIALVLVAVVILTSCLSYYQEGQSAKVMNSFAVRTTPQEQTPPDRRTKRDGDTQRQIDS